MYLPFSGVGTRIVLAALLAHVGAASAAQIFANGFEVDIAGWQTPTRVASGTNGVTSATGSFHAQTVTDFTRWGGYNFGAGGGVPTVFQEYTTSVDIYLDLLAATATNDVRFDFSSAINNASGNFLRDFVLNFGFYNSTDTTAPGAGTNRFVVSASNNAGRANSFPQNPGRDPFAISQTGWYTVQHRFYNNSGALNVDFIIRNAAQSIIHSWTIASGDLISNTGGNRYGWFVNNEFGRLNIDNTFLDTAIVPEPSTFALFGTGFACFALARRRACRGLKG